MNRGEIALRILNEIEARKVCEVGVRDGGFLSVLLRCPTVETAYAIDIWDEYVEPSQNDIGLPREILKKYYDNFKDAADERVVIIKKLSEEAVFDLPNDLDFIYIDADHTYDAVNKDLVLYYGRLRSGGVLAGHDYLEYVFRGIPFGVRRAVDEFAERYGLTVETSDEKFKSFFIRKP